MQNYSQYVAFFLRLEEILNTKTFKIDDSIIICSETRSGSTWLMEMLACIPDTMINWEPLHPEFGVIPSELKWGDRPFIPQDNTNPLFIELMSQLLTLELFSPWTLKYNRINNALGATKVLTKFVRANLLLPWIVKNYI